jgi:hypothetical protein
LQPGQAVAQVDAGADSPDQAEGLFKQLNKAFPEWALHAELMTDLQILSLRVAGSGIGTRPAAVSRASPPVLAFLGIPNRESNGMVRATFIVLSKQRRKRLQHLWYRQWAIHEAIRNYLSPFSLSI